MSMHFKLFKMGIVTSSVRRASTDLSPRGTLVLDFKSALSRFPRGRLASMRQIFDELAKQSSSARTLDKTTFLRYFPLPGMMGERLFTVFDTDSSGAINFQEFVTGMALIYHGTVDEKRKFLFEMYDLDGDGVVTREELTTMLTHVPAAFKILAASMDVESQPPSPPDERIAEIVQEAFGEKPADGVLTFFEFCQVLSQSPAVSEVLNILYDETLPERVDSSTAAGNSLLGTSPLLRVGLVCPMCSGKVGFTHCMQCGGDLVDDLIEPSTPSTQIAQIAQNCENCHIQAPIVKFCFLCGHPLVTTWKNSRRPDNDNLSIKPQTILKTDSTIDKSRKSQNLQLTDITDQSLSEDSSSPEEPLSKMQIVEQPPQLVSSKAPSSPKTMKTEGWLWKKGRWLGKWVHRFYVVRDPFLYYYTSESDEAPKGVIFLAGCDVEFDKRTGLSNNGGSPDSQHCLKVTPLNDPHKQRIFYAETETALKSWHAALSKAAKSRKIEDFFQVDWSKPLGKGKFSTVYRASSNEAQQTVAVKVIRSPASDPKDREFVRTEIAIAKLVSHVNIVKTIDVFETSAHIYVVMEWIRGGDLLSRLLRSNGHRLNMCETKIVVRGILDGLAYLHRHGITHRDIKGENILVEEGSKSVENQPPLLSVKLTDFGLSAIAAHGNSMEAQLGTIEYAAPEIILKHAYDKSVDLWSLGVVTFVTLTGKLPFAGQTDRETALNIVKCRFSFSGNVWEDKEGENAKDFVKKLLVRSPANRMKIEDALKHPWLTESQHIDDRL